jgi:hypothetical protein
MFVYYINGEAPARDPEIEAAGLADRFAGPPIPRHPCTGPDGSTGTILADPSVGESACRYLPDTQTWRQIPGSAAWIGRTDEPITPGQLARAVQLNGHIVRLADGQDWMVPTARAHGQTDAGPRWCDILPAASELDEEGNWVRGQILPAYRRLWELAEAWHNARAEWVTNYAEQTKEGEAPPPAAAPAVMEFDSLHSAAAEVLANNYRLGPVEVAWLGLLTEQHAAELLNALTDWPGALALMSKKKPPAS